MSSLSQSDRLALAVAMHRAGAGLKRIGLTLGACDRTVRAWLVEAGVRLHRPGGRPRREATWATWCPRCALIFPQHPDRDDGWLSAVNRLAAHLLHEHHAPDPHEEAAAADFVRVTA